MSTIVADGLRAKLRVESTQPIRIGTLKERGDWAFGSAVLPGTEAAYPQGWLYLVRGTTVAFEGEPAFADLAAAAPVLSGAEQRNLGPRPKLAAVDHRTGMRLPYALGQHWRLTGGPHGSAGGPRTAVDLAGGDGRVLAARDGLAYAMCDSKKGWIRVVHDRGFATDYYHLSGNIAADGTQVREGDFLGNIGTDVSCGGTATGPHVHFSIRRDGAYVPIDRYVFGKWVIRQSGADYEGFALHGSTSVGVDGDLLNYGPLGFTEGIVDTDGGGLLNRRAGPTSEAALVGTVQDGDTVTIACSAPGKPETGREGYNSTLWDKLVDGSWVSDVFVWTGTGDPVAGMCP